MLYFVQMLSEAKYHVMKYLLDISRFIFLKKCFNKSDNYKFYVIITGCARSVDTFFGNFDLRDNFTIVGSACTINIKI